MLLDPSKNKLGMAGRRGGKTIYEIAEVGVTCIDDGGYCGWGAPSYKILDDAWRDMLVEYEPYIRKVNAAKYTIDFKSGGRLECWSFDAGIIARSRKYHKFIIDEAGLIPNLGHRYDQEVEPTLGDYDGTLIACSTPNVVSPDFLKWFNLGQRPGTGWQSWRWSSLDNPFVAETMARRIAAARARGVPEWIIQQEYFAIPAETINGFFKRATVEAHAGRHAVEPVVRGTLAVPLRHQSQRDVILADGRVDRMEWFTDDAGAWRLWFGVRGGRPDVRLTRACMGIDIGCGVGASNSVISLGNSDTGEKIGEYAYPGDSPEELARIAVAMGYWIGGREHPALINFEANGPGEQFIKVLLQLGYPNIMVRRKTPVKVLGGSADEYGWWNTHSSKFSLFSEYRAALATDDFINPSQTALDECYEYFVDKANRVVHQRETSDYSEDESGAAIPHGDRVVADALLHQAMQSNPLSEDEEFEPPRGSFAWRQMMAEQEEA